MYGISKFTRRPRLLLNRSESLIFRTVPSKRMTAKECGRQIMVTASVWSKIRAIKKSGKLKYVKPCLCLRLT